MGLQSLGSGGYSSWCFDEYPLSPWRGSMVIEILHMPIARKLHFSSLILTFRLPYFGSVLVKAH